MSGFAERDYKHHGAFAGGDDVGSFRIATRVQECEDDDGTEYMEPEIVIYLDDPTQLDFIRVVTPDGNTHEASSWTD